MCKKTEMIQITAVKFPDYQFLERPIHRLRLIWKRHGKSSITVGAIPAYMLKTQFLHITGVVLVVAVETEVEEATGTFNTSL